MSIADTHHWRHGLAAEMFETTRWAATATIYRQSELYREHDDHYNHIDMG